MVLCSNRGDFVLLMLARRTVFSKVCSGFAPRHEFAFFSMGAYLAGFTRAETFALRDALNLMVAPEIGVLIILLVICALLMVLVTGGLTFLICLR